MTSTNDTPATESTKQQRIEDAVHEASMANELLRAGVRAYDTSALSTDGAEIQMIVRAFTDLIKTRLDALLDLTSDESADDLAEKGGA